MFGDNLLSTCSYSRAVDDDDDDELTQLELKRCLEFRWNSDFTSGNIPCHNFVVAVGQAAVGFVQAYILSNEMHEQLAMFRCTNGMLDDSLEEAHGLRRRVEWNGTIYRLANSPNIIIVQCSIPLDPALTNDWMRQITSSINLRSAHMTALMTYGWGEYRTTLSSSERPDNLMRCLRSSSCTDKLPCPLLEQPNMMSGLPAQVLTYCQINKMPCMVLACYCNIAQLDSDTLRAFYRVCSTTGISRFVKESEKTKEHIAMVLKQLRSDLALFM
jgi:proteasome assembly chaperone 1